MSDINKIAQKLGISVLHWSLNMLRSAYDLEPEIVLASYMEDKLVKKLNAKNITLSDGKYKLIGEAKWKEILNKDWTIDRWELDFFDCDNQAYWFSAIMGVIFKVNSAGIVHGHIYHKDTGKWIAGHFWNIIITKEGKIYFADIGTNSNKSVEYTGQSKIIMGNREYRPLSYRFF